MHIEVCLPCQEELERLTSGRGWRSTGGEIEVEPRAHAGGDDTDDRSDFALGDPVIDGSIARWGLRKSFSGDVPPADSIRTMTASGSPDGSLGTEPGQARSEWPRVPGYEIVNRLGEGGMGVVYKAWQAA